VAQRFEGRVAVVNGAASGIGRAIVQRVVAEGGSVAGGDIAAEGLESLQAELGANVATLVGDVTVEADAAALVALAVDHYGGLDAAFHVAGASRPALIVDMTEDDWDFTVDLCLKGVFLGVKHAAKRMVEQGRGGAIVNIASLNSRVPMFFGAAYSAAKAGVVSLGQSAALELGEHGIRVSTVSPGLTATPLAAPMMDLPSVHAAFMDRIPLRRPATPEDIAAAATFLASDDGTYISGVNLFVDGGWEHTAYPDLRPMIEEILANAEQQP
jgi:meso-butanediol dehydrogenase / (S,S)-butanediol dehydrogenase / diacetyl reductase